MREKVKLLFRSNFSFLLLGNYIFLKSPIQKYLITKYGAQSKFVEYIFYAKIWITILLVLLFTKNL